MHHSNRRPRLRRPPSSDVVVPQTTPGCRRQSSFLNPSSSIHPDPSSSSSSSLFLPPSPPPLWPKVFLFPSLAVKRGRREGEEGKRFSLAEERRERELSFLIFHGSSTPINWFTSNVYRAANELLLSALVLSSELQIVESSPAFLRNFLARKGKRKRDVFLKDRIRFWERILNKIVLTFRRVCLFRRWVEDNKKLCFTVIDYYSWIERKIVQKLFIRHVQNFLLISLVESLKIIL